MLQETGSAPAMSTVLAPVLWISILAFALTNISLGGPYSVALPFPVTDHLGGDVRILGLLYAVFPLGYLLGGIWLGRKLQQTEVAAERLGCVASLAMLGSFILLSVGFGPTAAATGPGAGVGLRGGWPAHRAERAG